MRRLVFFVLLSSCATFAAATAETLSREPPMGALKEGQRVLVDDGTCPHGQIKEVVGGNHVKAGGWKHIERRRRCIAR